MMLKKRLLAGFLIFLIVIPLFVFGLEEEKTDCSGFFGPIKCFLWGDASNRAGMGWFDREGALVGKVINPPNTLNYNIPKIGNSDMTRIQDQKLAEVSYYAY